MALGQYGLAEIGLKSERGFGWPAVPLHEARPLVEESNVI